MNGSINNYILFILIGLSIYFDISQKRIPNFITFPVIIWGLLIYSILEGFQGFKFSFLGFLLGLFIFMIPFILRGMGGGDVKMMAAIGALMGWRFILYTAIYTGLVGGIMVVLYLIYKGEFLWTFKKILGIILKPILFILNMRFKSKRLRNVSAYFLDSKEQKQKYYIPYGVAIGLGAVIVYFI